MRPRRYPLPATRRTQERSPKAEKISITVDENVLRGVREIVRSEGGTLSAHVSDTLARDLRRRRLQQIVDDYEREHGVIDDREMRKVRKAWQD